MRRGRQVRVDSDAESSQIAQHTVIDPRGDIERLCNANLGHGYPMV